MEDVLVELLEEAITQVLTVVVRFLVWLFMPKRKSAEA